MATDEPRLPEMVRRADDVLWRALPGGVLVLPRGRDEPLLLGGTAVDLWEGLAHAGTEADLVEALARRYRVDPSEVAATVGPALVELEAAGLVVRSPRD